MSYWLHCKLYDLHTWATARRRRLALDRIIDFNLRYGAA